MNARTDHVTLVRIENGEQLPRFEMLTALADALQLRAAKVLMDAASDTGHAKARSRPRYKPRHHSLD